MRVLTVPNWSFGRNKELERKFGMILMRHDLMVHFLQGDVDHNRTVSAFSGEHDQVEAALLELAAAAFDVIDLNHHVGVHPRIGALDVCPFVALDASVELDEYLAFAEHIAIEIARLFDVPVYLYEKSERGRHESDLPTLRRGGFGGMIGKRLQPDFGPTTAHPQLGVTVVGVRDFLVAMNVNLGSPDPSVSKKLASTIRDLRAEGDQRFLGVRALGLPLASREQSQVSLNITLPDLTPIDPIIEWIRRESVRLDVIPVSTELVGVIRAKDLEFASRLPVRAEQVVNVQ